MRPHCRLKTYLKGQYTDAAAYDYYMHARDVYLIHSETRALLEQWLRMLRDEGKRKPSPMCGSI